MSDFEERVTSTMGLPLKYIRSILKIDLNSPSGLMWLPRKKHGNQKDNCGCVAILNKETGYKGWTVSILYNKKQHLLLCSRIIFFLANGYLTKGREIDHIDGNPLNNRVENLREATSSQNSCNAKIQKNNTSGHKGIIWDKERQKWVVRITLEKKTFYLGRYGNLEEAVKVSKENRQKLHGKFGRDK